MVRVAGRLPASQPAAAGFAAVGEHIMSGRGNPDGIHWNFEAHQAVAELTLKALAEAGVLPGDARG